MPTIRIAVTDTVSKKLAEIQPRIAGQRTALIAPAARLLADAWRRRAPVRTGRLRDSIRVVPDSASGSIVVASDVPYAPFVEFGTSKMGAEPSLRPARDETEEEAQPAIIQAMKKVIE